MPSSGENSVQTTASNAEYKYNFHWDLDFSLNIGETNKRFFEALEEKTIEGNVCPECGNVFVPPRSVCDECFVPADEWVEVEQEGVVESYTVCFFQFTNMPEPPYITAVIRLGDAATCMLHFVEGIEYDDPEDLIGSIEKGTRVEPVWSDDRTGSIRDIDHFRPIE
ncbi:Zn-ribbon domain-containing OB-fold protein [Haloarchaeobius sp. DFWS5]|uniref:Zn-ribbon domain-containing OB-fold protein n=1 Tax=Haloarchaeobius sp. DFWS5 TaxID=3446114 RepID=UPI003EBE6FFF